MLSGCFTMPWVKPNKIDVKHQNLNELDRFWHQKCWIEPFKNRTLRAHTLNFGGSNQNCRFHLSRMMWIGNFYTCELETPRQKTGELTQLGVSHDVISKTWHVTSNKAAASLAFNMGVWPTQFGEFTNKPIGNLNINRVAPTYCR